ncbi:MAG TPA: hypothetical protein VGH76_05125 [Actinomycetospora sp.]|jgi:hypothetical protein|uniref:hypothetical protein n=1 Tax=Actinomycetospora sp. TaxID=1872135 RepID=UPI002F41772B
MPDPEVDRGGSDPSEGIFEMPDTIDTTLVTAWLVKNKAEQYKQKFFDDGYTELDDLSDEVFTRYAKAKTVPGGVAARLARALKDQRAAALKAPALPPKTPVDLSRPEAELPDGTTFTFPDSVDTSAEKTAIIDPTSLTADDWLVVARRNDLLVGWDMSDHEPAQANSPVLLWMISPENPPFVKSQVGRAEISTSVVFDASSATYVKTGFNTQTATASYLFASASFAREESWRKTSVHKTETLYMTGSWWFPRATLRLDRCTIVNPVFVDAVTAALKADDPRTALGRVFVEFGHAIPRRVTIGGELYFQRTRASSVDETTSQAEQSIRATIGVKFGRASAEVGGSFGSGSSETNTTQKLADDTALEVRGGDASLIEHREAWEQSVKDFKNWAVIRDEGNGRALQTVDLLPPELARQVRAIAFDLIGEPIDWDHDRVHRVTQDGFLLGTLAADVAVDQRGTVLQTKADGPRGALLAYVDDTADPRAPGGAASAHQWSGNNKGGKYASLLLPLRRSERANVHLDEEGIAPHPDSPRPRSDLAFIPLGPLEGETYLGPRRAAFVAGGTNTKSVETIESDGFLVCTMETAMAARAYLTLTGPSTSPLAALAVHYYPPNDNYYYTGSFCVPVRAGEELTRTLQITAGASSDFATTSEFVPLSGGLRLGPAEARRVDQGTVYTADDDGFLVGVLAAPQGGWATLELAIEPSSPAGSPTSLVGRTAVHQHRSDNEDNWLAYSTVTVPVSAGSTYQPAYNVSGTVNTTLRWIPLQRS